MKISKYFTYREALWLPQWKRPATRKDGLTLDILNNLKLLFKQLDKLRERFNTPFIIHCAYRPQEYNKLVGGAKSSAHMSGMAVDFHVDGVSCDEIRAIIMREGLLDSLNLRMEYAPGTNWVHIDTRASGPSGRYFKP